DRRQIVGLVQRRERAEPFKARQHIFVDDDRAIVVGTAMNDAVANRDEPDLLRLAQPRAGRRQGRGDIWDFLRCISFVDQGAAIARFGAKPRPGADAVDLALDETLRIAGIWQVKYLEFDA